MSSHSDVLWHKIRLADERVSSVCYRFWTHRRLAELLPRFFLDLYATMHGSVALMQTALARSRQMAESDPLARQLADYLAIHVDEEATHQDWLLDDLDAIGMMRAGVVAQPPSMAVAALVGSQYCWIEQAHPVALLGYLVVLEGNPPVVEELQEIQKRTGLPAEAFRCLIAHADKDPLHLAELNALLDSLPLEPYHCSLIAMSAFQTIDLLARMFEDLLDGDGQRHPATHLSAVPVR